ncbi:hemophore-related protein [Nocardia callitridis]|uniref:Hemophore-related protein n=1 Tax=Nocardia callitridis TaxID=648753 RepID=A0ABP9KY53_9NOCA
MKRSIGRSTIAAVTVGGAATVTMLLGPAIASADPSAAIEPLITSDCSFAQVDAALHEVAPELATALDANPQQKAQLQGQFDQPVEQRRAQLQQEIQNNPEAAQQAENDPRAAQMRSVFQQVADTCHNY